MKRLTLIATTLVVAFLVALTINARAQDFNTQERTFLTFSGPIEMPGIQLPAGTYTFRLADTQQRNVVQVLSQDEKKVHGQFLFVPATRAQVTGENVITFRESAEGTTPAVQYWYYPGEAIGKEFVYPKDQALKIAARTGSTVLSTDGEITPESTVSSVDSRGNVTAWERESRSTADANQQAAAPAADAPAPAQPTAAAGSLAGNRGAQTSSDAAVGTSGQTPQADTRPDTSNDARPESQSAASELPRTASPLPLAGLIGLLSMAGGLGLRMMRR